MSKSTIRDMQYLLRNAFRQKSIKEGSGKRETVLKEQNIVFFGTIR